MEVIILRFRVHGTAAREPRPFLRGQLDLDFIGNGTSNLPLQPHTSRMLRLYSLAQSWRSGETRSRWISHTHPVAGAFDRPFQDAVDASSSPAISCSDFLLALYCITD